MWCAMYPWKALDKDYNCALNLASIRGLHKKLWASKVLGHYYKMHPNSLWVSLDFEGYLDIFTW